MDSQIYEDRIVAFVDILGFKNMVTTSQDNLLEQQRIMRAMDIIHGYKQMNDESFDGYSQKVGIHITTFSDSAILSYPITYDGGLFFVLLSLIHLQLDLLTLGMFIRGGVSIGKAHHDEFNAFGPAIVQAYSLESERAFFPRIILSPHIMELGIKYSPSHQNEYDIALLKSLVQQDMDGWLYLDYLKQHQELDNPCSDYYELMRQVRHQIICGLNFYYNQRGTIYPKYQWLLSYWNNTLDPKHLTVPAENWMDDSMKQSLFKEYVNMRIEPNYPYK